MTEKFHYGGQAVIEGVMMRGQKATVTAVRRPGGEIGTRVKSLSSLYTGRIRRIPLLRGIVVLIEAIVLGIGSLMYSANAALEEEEEQISGGFIWIMVFVSFAFAIGIFFVVPLFLTQAFDSHISSSLVFHIIEGLVRLAIFIAYLKLISLLPDIKRVFAYHGAEHATINAFEAGVPLKSESVKNHSTAHTRCSTSFLLTVLLLAIIVFALVGRQEILVMVTSRILLLPVIAAIGYEITYFSARHIGNPLVKVVVAPGLWLQKMTNRKPNENQIEVAITALEKTLAIDQGKENFKESQSDESDISSSVSS